MTDQPTPRERRTARVVIYLTPGDCMALKTIARCFGMSVSEVGADALSKVIDDFELKAGGL